MDSIERGKLQLIHTVYTFSAALFKGTNQMRGFQ